MKQQKTYIKNFGTSKYIGTMYCKSSNDWNTVVTHNGKIVFTKHHKNEEYVARFRDLYILQHLSCDIKKYRLNFVWSKKEICKWNIILNGKLDKNVDISLLEEVINDNNKEYNTLIQKLDEIERQYHQLIQ